MCDSNDSSFVPAEVHLNFWELCLSRIVQYSQFLRTSPSIWSMEQSDLARLSDTFCSTVFQTSTGWKFWKRRLPFAEPAFAGICICQNSTRSRNRSETRELIPRRVPWSKSVRLRRILCAYVLDARQALEIFHFSCSQSTMFRAQLVRADPSNRVNRN